MGMVTSGDLAQCLPCFHGHMAIGLGSELQHYFAGVNITLDFWHALGDTFGVHFAVKFGQLLHLGLGIPAKAATNKLARYDETMMKAYLNTVSGYFLDENNNVQPRKQDFPKLDTK